MTVSPSKLHHFQRWFLQAITSDTADARHRLHVLPSRRQTANERLAVYQSTYASRLVACMRDCFPVFSQGLEPREFAAFATAYLESNPSGSYTLNRLADRFVHYLQATRPDLPGPAWPDFLIELAQLEQSIDQVFDGPGIEDLPPLDVAVLSGGSPDAFLATKFTAAPCLRLHRFEFPVNDYFTAVKRGELPVWPEPLRSYVAITRQDFVVRRISIRHEEFATLEQLAAGTSVAESLAAIPSGVSSETVQRWFASWMRLGLLIGYQ